MKRSSKVTLTVVAVMGLASCSRRRDPCEASYFDSTACADAVRGGGYYWHGTWYPMTYRYPYPYYYDGYQRHVQSGGKVFGTGSGAYARPSASSPSSSPGGTVRGGFGSTGSGHSTGA
jgi:hypothetical protein